MVQVLKQCGNDLTRANIMKQAANLNNFDPGMLLPGITINAGANNFAQIRQLQLNRFKGETWQRFGPIMGGETAVPEASRTVRRGDPRSGWQERRQSS
jgi:branched-chain amino acid transport system substrate-binding protein